MLVVVNTVSALVHIYSIGYMHHDPHRPRFFAYLSLFTFAMLMLVTSDNLVQMFFGWEGVGLASYLLIGFWYKKPSANAAAMKAFIVNRVGDFGFALGIFGVYVLFGSVNFDTIFANAQTFLPPKARRMRQIRSSPSLVGRSRPPVRSPPSACCSSWAPWASRLRCRSTPGSRRHGRPDAGVGAHPCRDDGHGRGLHAGAPVADLRAQPHRAARRHDHRHDHGILRRDRRARPERHQECHRVLDLLALGYMFVALGSASIPLRSSTSSRTPSSRRCCSSARVPSSTRCPTNRTCAAWAGCGSTSRSPTG